MTFDNGATLTTKAGKSSSSSSSSKTKLASKKLKVTAYVGTSGQMDTDSETGKSFKTSNKKFATVKEERHGHHHRHHREGEEKGKGKV